MNPAVQTLLEKYRCETEQDYANALKEIIQQIALLGLSRTHFFEHAAFYGGTALRILYGLDRFSEDMDFTLLKKNDRFHLTDYFDSIRTELSSFGFETEVSQVEKPAGLEIDSAFIKANTQLHLMKIQAPVPMVKRVQRETKLTIKFEIDTLPPGSEKTDAKILLLPVAHSVKTLTLPCLFGGKMHAVLYRNWKTRVKGRDWYDFVWYIARATPCDFGYLNAKMQGFESVPITQKLIRQKLTEKIESLDIGKLKADVAPFLKDARVLDLWSKEFFQEIASRITFV